MESHALSTFILICVLLDSTTSQNDVRDTVLNCCEGDVLLLLDSSGSISSYEFSRTLDFLSGLLLPFSLGADQVRVGLLQVGTEPHLEFGFGAHSTQQGLQGALARTKQLRGDTNTEEALRMAKERVLVPGGVGGARGGLPRVLVWFTDGVQPGAIEGPMAELRDEGVAVLLVSTGHGNYQMLRQVVSPPIESHLYFVDIDDINIIADDLRDAIIELIRAERLLVRDVSSDSAVLHWRPVLAGVGYYDIRFGALPAGEPVGGQESTSPSTEGVQYERLTSPGDSNSITLTGLKADTRYTASLTPKSNAQVLRPLNVTFTTQAVVLSPTVVTVSEAGVKSVRVSWGPLQPNSVQRYQIEYSALPRGDLKILTVGREQNSTVLTNLKPDTQYLITVSALHSSGQERAMSVKMCTQEVTPDLADLQLFSVGSDSVQVKWTGGSKGLRGYRITWEGGHRSFRDQRSSLYLPPDSSSTLLTRLPPAARVCVSPVYRSAHGGGLCCTAQLGSNVLTWDQ